MLYVYPVTEFVNLYPKALVFLRNRLLENNSPSEYFSNFMHRLIVKFSIAISELFIEGSNFTKSVIIVFLVWLIHIVAKMKSESVKQASFSLC